MLKVKYMKKENYSAKVRQLKVKESCTWSLNEHNLTSIRSVASQQSLQTGNTYETKTDSEARTITVTRVE